MSQYIGVNLDGQYYSLPHRQLRKLSQFSQDIAIDSLPHRQLRNAQRKFYIIWRIHCRIGSLEMQKWSG